MTAAESRLDNAAAKAAGYLDGLGALGRYPRGQAHADSLRAALDAWRAEHAEPTRNVAADMRERFGVLANHERLRRMEVGK